MKNSIAPPIVASRDSKNPCAPKGAAWATAANMTLIVKPCLFYLSFRPCAKRLSSCGICPFAVVAAMLDDERRWQVLWRTEPIAHLVIVAGKDDAGIGQHARCKRE